MHNPTEVPVSGQVRLQVPSGWKIKGTGVIQVSCPPGTWRQAVFSVTPDSESLTDLCLPDVLTVFEDEKGAKISGPLFVVGSPSFLSRERKATLIDARRDLSGPEFLDYFKRIGDIWKKDNR